MNMETYLRRTYGQKKRVEEKKEEFPFWDYRSRRGTFSSSNSNSSFSTSSNSSCDGSSISSASSRSETGSEIISISEHSDTDSLLPCDQQKMTVQFLTDPYEISVMEELYQPITNMIDPELHVIKITDRSETTDNALNCMSLPVLSSRLPSMALMVFLQEKGALGFERIQTVKRYFEKAPWKFHHSEHVTRGTINPYPYNSQDFYYTSEDLPLWAIRQVHAGKEFFRIMLFVGESNWSQMMQFYKLVLGCEPDVKREDFCLFTVNSFNNFNVQLALKKLQGETKPRVLESVKIQFRVNDLSNIVSMLPNVCRPLSDTRWETSDNEGNVVVLETPRLCNQVNTSFSDRCSLSERSSISDRGSVSEETSFLRRRMRSDSTSAKNGRLQNKLVHESKRTPVLARQRAKSMHVDEDVFSKLKRENAMYKQNAINAIRDQHAQLERSKSDFNRNWTWNKENDSTEEIEVNVTEENVVKSFYV